MSNNQGSCNYGKMLLCIIIMALAIQVFISLISIAVAAGAGYSVFSAFFHMFCWPIYFLSLCLAILLGIVKCLKGHCNADSKACCDDS
jgi:membrane associated rhomboid family serine protease